MIYLVILVLVAVLGIARLWHQQRKEQSQLDTIEGFSSALEAIKPEMVPHPITRDRTRATDRRRRSAPSDSASTAARKETRTGRARKETRTPTAARKETRTERARSDTRTGARRRSTGRGDLLRSLRAWFVAEPQRPPAAVRRRVEARRRARAAVRSAPPPAVRRRDIAYETLDLTDEVVLAPPGPRVPLEREMVGAGQTSYSMRMRNGSG